MRGILRTFDPEVDECALCFHTSIVCQRVKAATHQNHVLLKASRHSIESAAFWYIALERCCQQQLMIEATGIKPRFVTESRARYSREHVGSDYIGWLHFQTIWDHLVNTQPDMFD